MNITLPRDGQEFCLPPLIAAMATPACVIQGGNAAARWSVAACNDSWHALVERLGAGGPGSAITAMFPGTPPIWEDAAATGAAVCHRAAAVTVPFCAAAWFNLECLPMQTGEACAVLLARDVTDAVLARRELEDANNVITANDTRLVLAQETAGLGIWEWDLQRGSLAWSPGQFRLFGLQPSDALPTGAEVMQAIHPDDRAAVSRWANLPGLRVLQMEFRVRRADTGETRWLLAAMRQRDGAPQRLAGVTVDITERRRAEAALQESEDRLRLAMQAGRLGAWEINYAIGTRSCDETMARLLQQDTASLRTDWMQFIHQDDRAQVEAECAAAAQSGSPYAGEFRIVRGDGEIRQLTASAILATGSRMVGVAQDVTESRAAETLIRESRQRFQGLFDSMFQFTGLLAADGTIVKANRAVLDFGGLTREDALGRKLWDMAWFTASPDTPGRVRKAVAYAALGNFVRYELEAQGSTSRAIVDFSLRPIRNDAGDVILIAAEGRDISELKAAEAALRSAEQRLHLALDAASLAAWDIDPVTGAGIWSASFFRMVGLPPRLDGQAQTQAWRALVHPDDLAGMDRRIEAACATGGEYTAEHRLRLPTGEQRWFCARGCILRDAAGKPYRSVGVYQDITSDRQARDALAGNEQRLRSLMDSLPALVFSAPRHGEPDFQSGAWSSQTGENATPPADWIARLHPEDRAPTMQAWRHAVQEGAPFEQTHRLRTDGGDYRCFLTRAVLCRQDGAPRWAGISTEITDLAAAQQDAASRALMLEAQLADRNRSLAEAGHALAAEARRRSDMNAAFVQSQKLEALGQLTGSVAHDFNNVLAAITGSYTLIRRRTQDADIIGIVERGEQAAGRAAKLVAQLGGFARKSAVTPEKLDVARVLRDLEDLLCHAAGPAVHCAFDLPATLWPVLADPNQLGIAVLNLAVNARDAMQDGGTITISARNDLDGAGGVVISVTDTGAGMTPEILARAREAFFTTKPPGQGTGLGLAMVQRFTQDCGGAFTIESAPGRGTTAEMLLPRAAMLPSTQARKTALRRISAPSFALHGNATILLAEHDDQVRPLTAHFLREIGYTVIEAAGSAAAMAMLHTVPNPIGLLICEIDLPGAGGQALAGRLRCEHPSLPVLFVTTRPISAPPGATLMRKPFTDTALAKTILTLLGRRVEIDPAQAEPLLSRLRHPALRGMLLDWHAAKAAGEGYPRLASLNCAAHGVEENSFVAAVEDAPPPALRILSIGAALQDELARTGSAPPGNDAGAGSDLIITLEGAYRRCAATRAPVYQCADYDFGADGRTIFERLILPAAEDGETITHLLGIVIFENRKPDAAP